MSRTIRIVNYAVNGSGVGHLMRLVAASRWIRRYAAHAGVKAEIYFLTSSEADGLLFSERFASFKLPSKTIVDDTRIDKLTYLALAKQWVWHSLALLRPDLLVVDTFPRGSFGELLGALDLCRRRAFIYRPTKESFAARGEFQAMLPLYDLIVVPDAQEVPLPPGLDARVRYTGPVLARERIEMLPRAEARARLGVAEDRLAVWVSAGGGGDAGAEAQLHAVCGALRGDPSLHLVVAAGPLYRGRMVVGERVTWLERGAAELLPGIDVAVCAAGYNTWGELMHAGVPAVFLPQEKVADDQEARARRAVEAGAAQMVPIAEVPGALARWRDPAAREAAARAARGLVPRNHARELAAELLRLVIPGAAVDAAEEAIDDDVLAACRELDVELETVVEVMHHLRGDAESEPEHAREATALVRHMVGRGIPLAAGSRLIALLARKLAAATPRERGAAARRLLGDLEAFGDWNGAAALLKVLGVERQLTADAFAGELSRFLGGLRARGEDLYRGIALLSAAAGDGADVPTNQALLQAVRG